MWTNLWVAGKTVSGKVPICTALYHEQLTSKALRYGTWHVLPATYTFIHK